MKIVSIIGARPQFIKATAISQLLRKYCQEIIIHTGQHYDDNMSKIFFEELEIPQAQINLGIGGGSHAEQTGQMMIEIERILSEEKPGWVIVYGDTNSTLAGSLAATKLNIPVAHVESGLRSYNRSMPEEINRIICDHISQLLFCPTKKAVEILRKEGIIKGVHWSGDVMYDVLLNFLPHARNNSQIVEHLGLKGKRYALTTIHRAGNTDDIQRLDTLFSILGKAKLQIVLPIHPRTRNIIEKYALQLADNILLINPVGYLDMLKLEAEAEYILTDSGGVQKEAYWLGKRCITLRDETEWSETVEAGWNILGGVNEDIILKALSEWKPHGERLPFFGDGHAAKNIVDVLISK